MSTSQASTAASVRVSRLIKAGRDDVFRAWTDPEHLARWFGPSGTALTEARVDLQPGGAYRLCIESPERGDHTAIGTYREIDPPSRLVFTWDWEEEAHRMDVETLVTVELFDRDGDTEVVITHENLPSAEAGAGHEEGWNSTLDSLESHFE